MITLRKITWAEILPVWEKHTLPKHLICRKPACHAKSDDSRNSFFGIFTPQALHVDGLLQEFKQVNKQIESLRVYNSQLERQIESQKQMMAELVESIENATVIERGISPLMESMLKALRTFVELDVPFKTEMRAAAVEELFDNLDSAKFSSAEKFRQILEIYDIESEYSLSLETYRDLVDINADGSEVEVDMLRVGRIALMYQTKDKSQTGAWNKTTGSWETLGSDYRRPVDQGMPGLMSSPRT